MKQILFILFLCTFVCVSFAQQPAGTTGVELSKLTALIERQAAQIDSQQELLKEQNEAFRDFRKTIDSLAIPDTEPRDATAEAQRTLDRAVGILSSVSTTISILGMLIIALVSVTVAAGIPIGLYFYARWKQREKETKDAETYIAERYAEELGARIKITPLEKEPTAEVKKELDELSQRLKHVERLGGSLSAEDYYSRGYNFYYKGKYGSALEAFEKAIELKPDYAVAWVSKGVALGELGRHEESQKAIEKAIEIKPDDANAWSNKGVVLANLGLFDAALKAHKKAIALEPDNDNSWFNRACTYSLMKKKQEALSDLKKAIRLDEKSKEDAKKDKDFESLWDDPEFKKIVE